MGLKIGDNYRSERTFVHRDVAAFAAVSLDNGVHHTIPAEDGRLMVHGLHTASLATQIGGSINFISRTMTFDFLAPVWTGDTIICTATIDAAEDRGSKWRYEISFEFHNQHGDVVVTGITRGIIRS